MVLSSSPLTQCVNACRLKRVKKEEKKEKYLEYLWPLKGNKSLEICFDRVDFKMAKMIVGENSNCLSFMFKCK